MLYVVATPIGNLEDITYRAVRVLKQAETILCEDTRVTRTLLAHYDITTPMVAVHHHTASGRLAQIVERLRRGEVMALVTDAGTPGVSDPGNRLVAAAVCAGVDVCPVPGPTAVGALMSVAGVDTQRCIFLAYPPHKKGRVTFFTRLAEWVEREQMAVVYYDSVHRVEKNLALLEDVLPTAQLVVGREMTKVHEEFVRGDIATVRHHFAEHPETVRGEFSLLVTTGVSPCNPS